MIESGETLSVRKSNRMIITKKVEAQVAEEISRAVNQHIESIDESCSDDIFLYKVSKSGVTWTMKCCTVCGRPSLVHQDPWTGNALKNP